MLVTPSQVQNYMESNHSKSASRLFQTLKHDLMYDLSHTEYCIRRDHLFVILYLSNGCRSGVTVNMTIEEYKKARHFPEKGGYIIEVQNHKTDFVYVRHKSFSRIMTLICWQPSSVVHVRRCLHPIILFY